MDHRRNASGSYNEHELTALQAPSEQAEPVNSIGRPRDGRQTKSSQATRVNLSGPENIHEGYSDDEGTKPLQGSQQSKSAKIAWLSLLNAWWIELLSLMGVSAALVAIVVTLATHQGQPLQRWPYRFSINSLVSAYAVVLKGSMLLIISAGLSHLKWTWFGKVRPLVDLDQWDQASRGPLGSAQLIWHLRGRHLIATIGAIVTILALAIDPLVQLLVKYDKCVLQMTEVSAYIPRAGNFSEYEGTIGAGLSVLSVELEGAITAGFFSPLLANITATCSTGNCTFDKPYHTVGYCSSCADITSQLSLSIRNDTFNFSLPSGLSNVISPDATDNTHFVIDHKDLITTPTFDMIVNDLEFYNGGNRNVRPEPYVSGSSWMDCGYGAASCSVRICIRSYMANVSSGVLQENLVRIGYDYGTSFPYPAGAYSLNIDCIPDNIRQLLIANDILITESTHWLPIDRQNAGRGFYYDPLLGMRFHPNDNAPNVTIPPECLYFVSGMAQDSIGVFLRDYIPGTVNSLYGYPLRLNGTAPAIRLYNRGKTSFEYVNDTFTNLAEAMTRYLRRAHPEIANNKAAIGSVQREEICIYVRWPYMVLPVALGLLTLVFSAAVVIQTHTYHKGCDWKDSALALLFHGFQQDSSRKAVPVSALNTRSKMEDVAKHMQVRLTKQSAQEGWAFVVSR